MNNAQMSARVGLFFLLGLALLWVTFEALHGGGFSAKKGYRVTAVFASVKQLKVGDDVRLAGVKVGVVDGTKLVAGTAEVTLRLQPEVQINRDSVASIAMSSMLGGNYVSLTFGTPAAGLAAEGGKLEVLETGDLNTILADIGGLTKDIKGALAGLSGLTGTGSGSGGPSVMQKLDQLVTANSENLTKSIENLQVVTAQLRGGQGTLGKLLNDPKAYDELLATVAEIKKAAAEANAFVTDARTLVTDVKNGKGTVGTLLYDEKTADNLRVTVQNIRELSVKLNSGQGTIGKLLTDDTLYKDAQGVIRKADRALDGMGDQGPITAVGVAANALF